MMKCNNTPKLEGLRDRLITVAYIRYSNPNTQHTKIRIRLLKSIENINDSNTIKLFYNSICKRIIKGYKKCAQQNNRNNIR